MLKSMIAFLAVLLILLFALSNMHNIQLHFVTGNPFTVRLAFLVLFSYLLGVLSASYFFIMAGFNAKRKTRKTAEARRADEEEDEEDL